MMRVSWNKQLNPILRFFANLFSPKLTINKVIYISRKQSRLYPNPEPAKIYVYYAGKIEEFYKAKKIVLNIPGGGFVTSPPPCHESYLKIWCRDTNVPIFSIDYKKAPEYPYPYAIEECYDVYKTICETKGRCLGLSGLKIYETKDKVTANKKYEIPITIVGDSSGGNISCGVMFKIIQNQRVKLPHPKGLILIYPCLDFNISSWMTKNQVQVFRSQSVKSIKALTEIKDHFKHNSPLSTTNDTDGKFWNKSRPLSIGERVRTKSTEQLINNTNNTTSTNGFVTNEASNNTKKKQQHNQHQTQLTMTSRVSYFNDRILTPDMMRAMAILYIGPDNLPDLNHDYYLSPIVAPEELLAQFPLTYLMCGEKDPFVDDTVLFGGRIRLAKKRVLRKSAIFSKKNSSISINRPRKNSIKKLEPLDKNIKNEPTNNLDEINKDSNENIRSSSSQNVKFTSDTKHSKFTIGDDDSTSEDEDSMIGETTSTNESDIDDGELESNSNNINDPNEHTTILSDSSSNSDLISTVRTHHNISSTNMNSTDLLAPARSYARLFPMSASQFGMDKNIDNKNDNSNNRGEKYGVDIKLLAGCSHAFLLMDPFLSEAMGSIEFISSWIRHMLRD